MDIDDELDRARGALRAGKAADAERRLRHILEGTPDHSEALHLMGLIAHRRGESRRAAEVLRRAVAADPGAAEAWAHLAEVLRVVGEVGEAVAAGREAVRLAPHSPAAHNNLGLAHQEQGQMAEAEASFRAALACEPGYARAHCNLGNLLRLAGRLDEAAAALRTALRLQPRYPQALNALGVVLGELGRASEASDAFHAALRQAPRYPKPLLNLGNLFARLGRLDEALTCYDQALRLEPRYLEAMIGRAGVLRLQERPAEEIEGLRRAVRELPADPRAHGALAQAYVADFQFERAAGALERVLELDPTQAEARAGLELCRACLCRWDERESRIGALRQALAERFAAGRPSPLSPHGAVFFPFSAAEQLAIARSVAEEIRKRVEPLARQLPPVRAAAETGAARALRIGYLSSDFRDNALAHLTRRLYGLHDRQRFEVVAYSLGPDDGSEYRRGIAADCDRFVDLRTAGDLEGARRIREDGIDILVDLVGFARGGRPEILALRPAPLQVSWLYPGTMGGVFHDYLVGDPVVTPPDRCDDFGEQLIVLPHCYQVNDNQPPEPPSTPSRPAAGLPQDRFVFCSFNNHAKLEPVIFEVWMRILERVPGSVLWLLALENAARDNLQHEAQARGVAAERLVFAPHLSKAEHLARHRLADLFLDTPICNAHTTASDALWSGVALVTTPGDTFASRVATSLLQAIGLPELVAADLPAYERLAVELASDPGALAAVRQKLAEHRDTWPLFDTPRFVRDLERAYLAIWRRHQAGEQPEMMIIEEA